MTFSRYPFGIATVLLLFTLSCSPGVGRPSFVLILIDTLRSDYVGCYGFEGPVSPELDRLAESSHVFRRCYAPAPWTKPSMASMFTSLNPVAHGVTNHEGSMWGADAPDLQKGVLRDGAATLAERLAEEGYQTAAFVANPWMTREYGFSQGFSVYDDTVLRMPADTLIARAESWMDRRDPEKPFFLYLHFMEVHAPYDAPDTTYQKLAGSPPFRGNTRLPAKHWNRLPRSILESRFVGFQEGDDGEFKFPQAVTRLEIWRGRYAAGMRDLDDRMGPFVRRLEGQGVLDDVYLIVTSDHGEELYDHGFWEHGYTLYEEQIHVPLIIRPPGGLKSRQEHNDLVGLIDLMPTLLALGGEEPAGMAGSDLTPLLEGGEIEGPRYVLSSASRLRPQLMTLVLGSYKLMSDRETNQVALFDVVRDPGERRNLARKKPKLVRSMMQDLTRIVAEESGKSLFEAPTEPVPQETKELLESLGYTN